MLALLLLFACSSDEEEFVRFNQDDQLQIAVTAEDVLGDPIEVELLSTTGAVPIGVATVTPGSGPVGTEHELEVLIDDEFQAEVDRVTVETDAGARGVEEHELIQDSADHGLWWQVLESVGEEGEVRTDTFTIQLWAESSGGSTDTDGAGE